MSEDGFKIFNKDYYEINTSLGSLTKTGWNLLANALSFSKCNLYSSIVVEAIHYKAKVSYQTTVGVNNPSLTCYTFYEQQLITVSRNRNRNRIYTCNSPRPSGGFKRFAISRPEPLFPRPTVPEPISVWTSSIKIITSPAMP